VTRKPFLSPDSFALIGMVHLKPLFQPHSDWTLEKVEEWACNDALTLAKAGFEAIMIENFGDSPFFPEKVPPHTIAAMTRMALRIRDTLAQHFDPPPMLGINVLRNDPEAALSIAAAVGASFIRVNVHTGVMVTDQGILQGKAHETVRLRDQLLPDCLILADLQVKHAAPLVQRPLHEEAEELWLRGRADALILSGSTTGRPVTLDDVHAVAEAVPGCPLLVGSGATPEMLPTLSSKVHGAIVGSWLKEEGHLPNPVSSERSASFVQSLRNLGY
jgi:membrane complex biogenesis BtpA family protein